MNPIKLALGGMAALFAAIMMLTVVFGSWYTIDEGERGVVLRNGAFTTVATQGLNFKFPIIDDVKEFEVRNQVVTYDKLAVYSTDIQPAEMRLAVTYKVPEANVVSVYQNYGLGYVDRVITPAIYRTVKEVFGRYQAANVVLHRDRMGTEMFDALTNAVEGTGVQLVSLQIQNIDFSDAYEHAIEQAMQAEAEVKKVRQQLERQRVEAEKRVVDATAAKEAEIERATGESMAIKLKGDAEAEAIRARGKALKENKELVELITAERWNGVLPTQMIPGSAVPFVNINK